MYDGSKFFENSSYCNITENTGQISDPKKF